MEKAKAHPAYVVGTLDFLQWGMEQFEAREAMQFLAKEKALFNACGNTNLANLQASFAKPLAVGDSLDFGSLMPLAGTVISDLTQVKLFVFWSSECPPCVMEFDQLHRWMKYNRPDLQVLAIAVQTEVKSWQIEKEAFDSWTHLLDSNAWQGTVARRWQVAQLPLFVLSDQKGRVAGIYRHTADLRRVLEP
jgi:thiol-disulfide isomerase/thioredoxin